MPSYSSVTGLWTPTTPLAIPIVVSTSGVASPILSVTHTLDSSHYPTSTNNAATYSIEPLIASYLPATANLTNPANLTLIARPVLLSYGSPSVNARASAAATGVQVDIGGAADPANQVYAELSWMRAGTATKAPVLRMEGRSFSVHGPIGAQATLLLGNTVYLQKYHASQPTLGPAAAYVAVTKPGAGFGAENGHSTATSFTNEAAFQAAGYAGPPGGSHTRGWHAGFRAGGYASAAMTSSETSVLGAGFEATDVEEAGLKVSNPLSASGLAPKAVWIAPDAAGRTWDWLLYHDPSANTPTSGALLLPGANSTAGQVKWGTDGAAPYLFRQANETVELRGVLRVIHGGGVTDPQVFVSGTATSDSPAFVAQSGGGFVKLAVPGVNDTFLSGSVAGDALLLVTSTKTLRFGNDANATLGVVAPGPKWGFGTASPTDGVHAALGARFSGTYSASALTATNAGVYLGVDTAPKTTYVTGTSGQRKWELQNVSGVFTLSEPGTTHLTLSNTTLTLPSKLIAQTGAGTNTFAGGLQVDGSTRLATSLTGVLKATAGAVTAAVAGVDYEAALGNPGTSGFVLTSTTGGVRSWVAQSGGALNTASFVTMAAESTLPNSVALGAGVNMAGLLAALPSSGFVAGRTYLATNDRGGAFYRDSGSAMVQVAAPVTHAAQHQPGGADPLVTASAVGLANANAAGSGTALALATHTHARDLRVIFGGSDFTHNLLEITNNSGSITLTENTGTNRTILNIPPPAGATPAATTVTALTDTAGGIVGATSVYAREGHAHERSLRAVLGGSDYTENHLEITTTAGSVTLTDDPTNRKIILNIPPPGTTSVSATVADLDGTARVGTSPDFSSGNHTHGYVNASITNAKLVNSSLTVTAGTGLSWASGAGVIALGAASPALNLANISGVAGSYNFPTLTIDGQGRVTVIASGTTGTPVDTSSTNAAGSGTALALANHQHRSALPISVNGTAITATPRRILNLVAGTGIGLVPADNGSGPDQVSVTINNTVTAPPLNAPYVTMAADATLTNETVLGTGVNMASTLALRPAASVAGRVHLTTDDDGGTPFRDDGTAWAQMAAGVTQAPQLHAASHVTGGDLLPFGSPVALGANFVTGSAPSFANSAHVHQYATQVGVNGTVIAAQPLMNLVAGSGIGLSSQNDTVSNPPRVSVTITNTAQAAPTDVSYVTMSAEAALSNETVLGTGVSMAGTLGTRPTPAVAGPIHLTTDDDGGTPFRFNGTAWVQMAAGVTQAPQPHWASHQPGGTDPLTTGVAAILLDVLAANQTAGSGTALALANHGHRRDLRVSINGVDVSTPTRRNRLNLLAGTAIGISGADDSANDQSTVTIGVTAASVANDRLVNPGITINTGAGLTGGSATQTPLGNTITLSIPNAGVTNAMLVNSVVNVTAGPGLSGGGASTLAQPGAAGITLSIGNGQVTNPMLANPGIIINTTAGHLTGGSATQTALGGTLTLGLPNVGPGVLSFTRASVTLDAQGRVTAASNGGAISLTADVSGILPIANGGTNASTAATARANLGAAASGTNIDIGSLAGLNTQAAIQVNPFGAAAGQTGEIRLLELAASGAEFTAFKAPDALGASIVYVLPSAAPTNGQLLQAGTSVGTVVPLSWTSPASGTITSIGPGAGNAAQTGTSGLTFSSNPISSGAGTLALSTTGVNATPTQYTNPTLTVDPQGRILTAANGSGSGLSEASASAPFDPPSITHGDRWVQDFTVNGATLNDVVSLSFSTILPDGMFIALPQVVAANTVRVMLFNGSGATQDLAAGTLQFYSRHLSGTAGTTSMLVGTTTWDPPSLKEGAMEDVVISVPGAQIGASCKVSFSQSLPPGLFISEQVDSVGQVTATVWNTTDVPVDLASGLVTARVWL